MLQEVVDDWLLYLEALEESPLHDDDDVSFDRTAYIICKQKQSVQIPMEFVHK